MVAALFALHPLHVESVAWVSERKDVLSAFFFLLTLGAYAAYAARGSRLQYVLALVFFALGLMSKPMLVTLPFVLLLLDWWPLQRLRFVPPEPGRARTPPALGGVARRRKPSSSAGQKPTTSSPRPAPPAPTLAPVPFWLPRWGLLAEKLPFFALSAASCLVTFVVQRQGGAVSTVLPLEARFANALVSYARYLAKTFWPANLSVLYPHPGHWPVWQVIGSSLLLVGTSAAVGLLARRRPYAGTGWLWFLGILVPVIGLIQVGVQSMADRYMYLPLVGILILVVWGLTDWLGGPARRRARARGGRGPGLDRMRRGNHPPNPVLARHRSLVHSRRRGNG